MVAIEPVMKNILTCSVNLFYLTKHVLPSTYFVAVERCASDYAKAYSPDEMKHYDCKKPAV